MLIVSRVKRETKMNHSNEYQVQIFALTSPNKDHTTTGTTAYEIALLPKFT